VRQGVPCEQANPTWGNSQPARRSAVLYLIGESKILSSAIRRPTPTSALSANHIPRIKCSRQPASSCRGVSPASASPVVCITANPPTRGALSVQDAHDLSSFGKIFFFRFAPKYPNAIRVGRYVGRNVAMIKPLHSA
jgi:hypothetical protein